MFNNLFTSRRNSWKTFTEINPVIPHQVTFGISIRAATIGNWKHTCKMLNLTLSSVLLQSDSRINILIAGHQIPDISIINDKRINFIQSQEKVVDNITSLKKDRDHKLDLLLKKHCEEGAGYFMPLDADDLIHKDLVKNILSDDNKLGYSIRRGYVLDWLNKRLAPVPGAWNADFDNVCGSSAIFYLHTNDFVDQDCPTKYRRPHIFTTSHGYWRVTAQEWGRPLKDITFPACIYIVNHSQNISFRIQRRFQIRKNNIINNIQKYMVNDINSIIKYFSISPEHLSNFHDA